MSKQHFSLVDQIICGLDRSLRTLSVGSAEHSHAGTRDCPRAPEHNDSLLSEEEKKHSAGLMRVNHSGEVCAQALYHGQALSAKLPRVREEMEQAAKEEVDHLAWCENRLRELNAQPSVLNPLWYTLSFGIGVTTGLISDRVSLGFVAATEEQVCKHLLSHLERLPDNDKQSKAIVNQMLLEEEKHAHSALNAGGMEFFSPIKTGMSLVSRLMTETSYRI